MKLITTFYLIALFISFCSAFSFIGSSNKEMSYQEQIDSLSKKLDNHRYTETKQFRYFPPQLYQQKGLYSSNIHGNAMDESNSFMYHIVREYIGCPDINMFVTNFVLSALLDCAEFGTIEIDQDLFEESIETILDFRDKNQEEGIPSYSFWHQAFKNGTWYSNPVNLEKIAESMKFMPKWVKEIFDKMGLMFVAIADQIADAFHLPPDADDSSVNIALGVRLMNSPFIRQSTKDRWFKSNYNIKGFYDLLKKYSYKPFDSSNSSMSTIDIRTYYGFHEYLQSQNKSNNFSVFTTWIRSTDDQIEKLVAIPSNTNNFDCSVISNTLFGLHHILLNSNATEVERIFDEELQGLYLNSSSTIIYAINSNIAETRPDIAFFYYPSIYDFYWFVARNVHFLNSNQEKIEIDLIKSVASQLNNSMKNQGTQYLLRNSKINEQGDIYWEEFLGVYNNKTYHEDATFATVMALNALVDTWTISVTDQQGKVKRVYDPLTPQNVTVTIEKGIKSLTQKNSFSKSNINAFFSGSFKSLNTWFNYPMNVNYFLNGTVFDPHTTPVVLNQQVVGIKGIIDETEYSQMLNEKWFQYKPFDQFQGYNNPDYSYPFWSSPAITFSMAMTLLSKYQSIH